MVTQEELERVIKEVNASISTEYKRNAIEIDVFISNFRNHANKFDEFTTENLTKVIPLLIFMAERGEAVILLAGINKLWDAEIIFRSMLEVLAKIYYIFFSEDYAAMEERLKQYWEVLALIDRVRTSDKAKEMIAANRGLISVFKPLVLSSEQEEEIKQKPEFGNRTSRNIMKEDWSFSGIIKNIVNFIKENDIEFIPLTHLNHYYKMASHLVHGDQNGISIIEDRKVRNKLHRTLAELVHLIKIGRTVNQMLGQLVFMLYLFVGHKESVDMAYKDCINYSNSLQKLHVHYEREQSLMGGYFAEEDLGK